jgi:predicted RNA polymerase sigma factor
MVEAIYLEESRRVFATLIRLLDDFDRAEDAHCRAGFVN